MISPLTNLGPTADSLYKAAFLDRDGVINVDHGYVSQWVDFEFLPGAIEGMSALQNAGHKLIIITNQSGIARGYFTEIDYLRLTNAYTNFLAQQGVIISGVYHCPHHPDYPTIDQPAPCNCRKPRPGLIFYAQKTHQIDLSRSVLFGDRQSDIEAGFAAGITSTYLVARIPSSINTNFLDLVYHYLQSQSLT
jgi:D-glycero-D-manno-heptose 1,7-bisphosphate phosphatase